MNKLDLSGDEYSKSFDLKAASSRRDRSSSRKKVEAPTSKVFIPPDNHWIKIDVHTIQESHKLKEFYQKISTKTKLDQDKLYHMT